MSVIKSIIEKGGHLDKAMVNELSIEFPDAQIIIKWVIGSTTIEKASNASAVIAQAEQDGNQVRELVLASGSLESLCEEMGEFCFDTLPDAQYFSPMVDGKSL